jgi:hypothetical protein
VKARHPEPVAARTVFIARSLLWRAGLRNGEAQRGKGTAGGGRLTGSPEINSGQGWPSKASARSTYSSRTNSRDGLFNGMNGRDPDVGIGAGARSTLKGMGAAWGPRSRNRGRHVAYNGKGGRSALSKHGYKGRGESVAGGTLALQFGVDRPTGLRIRVMLVPGNWSGGCRSRG